MEGSVYSSMYSSIMDRFPVTQELRTSRYVVSWREKEGAEEAGLNDVVKKKAAMEILIHIVGGPPLYSSAASWLYKLTVDPSSIGTTSIPLPVFTFDFKHKYPEGMGCVLYEKKLYFMGGCTAYVNSYKSDGKTIDHPVYMKALDDLCNYPPTVYVFDCQTSKLLNHNSFVPPMTSGKSEEPLTFVFDHVLYVLSSRLDMPLHVTFEAFDFNQPKKFWTKLTPLPDFTPRPDFNSNSNSNYKQLGQVAYGSALIQTKGEFLVSFSDKMAVYQYGFFLFSYNIKSGQWRRLQNVQSPYDQSMTFDNFGPSTMLSFNRDSVFYNDCLYTTFDGDTPVLRYGPLTNPPDDVLDLGMLKPVDQMNSRDWQVYRSREGASSRYLIHMYEYHFGFLELYDHLPLDYAYDDWRSLSHEGRIPCILRFVLFEEDTRDISEEDTQDISEEDTRDISPDPCFRANTLHSCDFHLTVNKNVGHINAAYVMPC